MVARAEGFNCSKGAMNLFSSEITLRSKIFSLHTPHSELRTDNGEPAPGGLKEEILNNLDMAGIKA